MTKRRLSRRRQRNIRGGGARMMQVEAPSTGAAGKKSAMFISDMKIAIGNSNGSTIVTITTAGSAGLKGLN